MSSYPCNLGAFQWRSPTNGGSFRPRGQLHAVRPHDQLDGKLWTSKDTLAARIIVGFNVNSIPTWTLDDLIPIVRRIRTEQAGDPSSTFVTQKGIYQHRDAAQAVVEEDGAQVLIIDMASQTEDAFEEQMVTLAEEIAKRLQQESVILEIQRNGITQRVHGITP